MKRRVEEDAIVLSVFFDGRCVSLRPDLLAAVANATRADNVGVIPKRNYNLH